MSADVPEQVLGPASAGPAPRARWSPTPRWLAVGFFATVTGLSLVQLFAGSSVGLADNGDGPRLMCTADLMAAGTPSWTSAEWHYVPVDAAHQCQAGRFRSWTLWSWVVRPVVWVYQAVTGSDGFDLRVLGVVDSVLLGALVAAVVLAWPGSVARRAAVGAAVAVVVLDIGFVTYFSSPLTDAAGLLGLLALLAAGIRLAAAPRVRTGHLLAVAAAAGFVMLSKNQLVPIVLVVIPLLLWRPGRRLLGAGLAVCLVAAGGLYLASTGPGFAQGNTWNLLFGAVLAESPDPAQDLRELGMDPALAKYTGTNAWEPAAGWNDPIFLADASRLTKGNVAGFLLTHPDRAATLVGHAVTASTDTRPTYLSNYADPGATEARLTERPNPVERTLGALRPVAWPVLPVLWLAAAVAGLWAMFRGGRRVWGVALFLTGGGALVLCLAGLGDGYYELGKHQMFTALSGALLLALGCVAAVSRVSAAVTARRRG